VTIFCFYTATIVGTSRIPSLVPLVLGLWLFSSNFLWGHLDEASLIAWKVIEYMDNNLVDLMSSKITRNDILELLYIYLASLTARGITVLLFYPLL